MELTYQIKKNRILHFQELQPLTFPPKLIHDFLSKLNIYICYFLFNITNTNHIKTFNLDMSYSGPHCAYAPYQIKKNLAFNCLVPVS